MKAKIYKRTAAALTALLMAGLCLAGCNNAPAPAPANSSAPAPSKAETESTPASEAPKEITNITWYVPQDKTQTDEQKVFDELNKYTEEKIGVHVKQIIYKNADYNEKVPTMIASGQKYDICFTASWGNKFLPNVQRGAYLDITELLPQYAKETKDLIPEMVWKASTVNGKIYAIPAYKEIGSQPGLMINSDLAKKAGIDLTKIKTFADLEPVLKQVKEKLPGVIPYANSNFNLLYAYEPLGGSQTMPAAAAVPGFSEFSDQGNKVFNLYDTKEFEDYCKLMYSWKQAGYVPDDPVTYDTDNAGRDRDDQANKLFSWIISYAPGYKDSRAATIGHGVEYIPLRDSLWTGGGGMMAISALSDHPNQSLEFLNLVNTDPYVATLIRHGIKDVHYKDVEVNGVKMADPYATGFTAENHPYNIPFGWQFGCVFPQEWVNSYPSDIVDQFKAYNDSAKSVAHLGFNPDLSNIGTEQAALSNVVEQYLNPLSKGMANPATDIAAFRKALKDNGVDKFIADIQTQIDTWNAANGK